MHRALSRLRSGVTSSRRLFGSVSDLSWNTAGINRHGFPWPPDCTEESLDFAEKWVPRDDDVFIVTYPKSGTTWTIHVAYQLATKGDMDYETFASVYPFWESDPGVIHASLPGAPRPSVVKTHAPMSLIPSVESRRGKYIYVVRDPRDVCLSFYNHSCLSQQLDFDGTLDTFYQNFMDGKLFFGSWFDHVEDALKYRERSDVLFLTYEEMAADLPTAVRLINDFSGFGATEDEIQSLLPRFSFAFMKEHKDRLDFTLQYPNRAKGKDFFNKGKVGGGRAELSEKQQAAIAARYAEVIGDQLPYKF